jgi:hypothetical protein
VRSRHDLFEATGVACTDRHTSVVHRLIVLETRGRDVNDDVAMAVSGCGVRISFVCDIMFNGFLEI